MLILSIETSTPRSSVALAEQDRAVATATLNVAQRHSEFVSPAVRFCLDQSGATVDDITGVAVGIGPGLFTGLRVGIATARAFASAKRLPIVGLSGLDVLAFRMRHARRLVCAAIDARRGELFWAFYRCSPGGVQRATDLRIGTPQKLVAEIESTGEECLVIGDVSTRYRSEFAGIDATLVGPAWPDAAALAELAIPRFEREETQRPEEIQPLYLRHADARIGWEARGRMRGGTATTP